MNKRNNECFFLNNVNVIGKKNNLTSVSDADREIPTLGSTDNAGNAVNYSFTLGLGFLCLHRRPMTDSFSDLAKPLPSSFC